MRLTSRRRTQGGISLILVAMTLIPLFGMLGLAMDGGRMFIVRNEIQAFADASALAAVASLDGTRNGVDAANAIALVGPQGNTTPNAYDFGTAVVSGVTTAYATSFSGTYDSLATASGPATNSYRFIRVAASAQVPLYFLPVINGIPTRAPLSATAIAGQQPQSSAGDGGLAPFVVDAHNAADTKNFGLTPGVTYTLKWGAQNVTNCAGDSGFNPGMAPSEHGFVDLGQGSGNSAIRDAILNGGYPNAASNPSSVSAGISLSGVPGNRGSSIFGALDSRAQQDTDQVSSAWSQYAGNNRRVITAPIGDPATWSGNGSNASITVVGFGNFLLATSYAGNSGPICAVYIGPADLNGSSSGGSDGTKIYRNYLYQ